eukprot:Skav214982  [mRNA]  locus=scaffold508:200599:201368:- [translate_table: standard]
MEVCSAISGETLALCDADELEGKSVKAVKQLLAVQLDISRFRQRLLAEDGSRAIPDEEVLTAAPPVKIQLDERGQTPLHYAANYGHLPLVKLLLEAHSDANVTSNTRATPLLAASQQGHLDVVRFLIGAGADVNRATTTTGASPLFFASKNAHPEVVRCLIGADADVNQATTETGSSPLRIASKNGHLEVVRLLTEAGADQNWFWWQPGTRLW